jgi:hypothetical protein
MSVLQDLILDVIPGHKCHMIMSPILSGYGAVDILNSRRFVPHLERQGQSCVLQHRKFDVVVSLFCPLCVLTPRTLPVSLVTFESMSPWLLGRCAAANMMYSHAERMFVLEHYFTSKSFAAFREVFSSAYPDKGVLNKTTMYRLVTIRDTGSVCCRKHVRPYLFKRFSK